MHKSTKQKFKTGFNRISKDYPIFKGTQFQLPIRFDEALKRNKILKVRNSCVWGGISKIQKKVVIKNLKWSF